MLLPKQWANDVNSAYHNGATDMQASLLGHAEDAYREGWCAGVVGGLAAAVAVLVAVAVMKAWC